ncbi:hypothetical protein [Pseudoclavibacter sp. JSM 162008]|uniref:hypothetical protein n=1 Tax=Pseudoclavibacter sp. JSM 162008 TaxID=3229855 RepID=UPI00352499F7
MTSKNVQLSGRLPGNERNGLEDHYDEFLDQGGIDEPLRAVVDIDRKKWAMDDVTEEPSAVLRITRIEVAGTAEDRATLDAVMSKLTKARLGDEQLDFDGDEPDEAA